ncbi:MAG TPA: DNA methyltransferase [Pyrinomonadaceae bacterium]|jgi:type II restriction/modification system DNA methylase subunit YeeA|nr:DNA methyltransferase [Pyrinomonadaceae bacterium]
MNIPEFISKWSKSELKERAGSQEHFLDLCEVFNHPKPAFADPLGEEFTFEKGAAKHGGGQGFADVWKRDFFGWEYKGKHKDLDAAYDQLLRYREALENPPLLVVCDMERFVIHTNFTATPAKIYEITLDDLATPEKIEILRNVFFEPAKLRPDRTSAAITKEVARRVGEVAQGLRKRGIEGTEVARFLDRIVFCLFAEDVGLLPKKLFSRLVDKSDTPQRFTKLVGDLFAAMAEGGDFGADTILHFNGNLFTSSPVLELTQLEMRHIQAAARLDWSAVDPSIFGTLFERELDPDTRAQLGAQYTSREDIETLVDPVVMQPLRREWNEIRNKIETLLIEAGARPSPDGAETRPSGRVQTIRYRDATRMVRDFHHRLSEIKVLDPACGSGNFLYVMLQKLKDLEKEVLVYASENRLGEFLPLVNPLQFYGIEKNAYAFDLAQTTLWIGYLQWIRANGFGVPAEPILRPMDNFKLMDAILDLSDPENPKEPEWPEVDFIVGNPPFLGAHRLRGELGDDYIEALFTIWEGRVPAGADLVTHWFEKARGQIEQGKCKRAGLLATQGIRGGTNREVLKRIKAAGDIFFAESDRNWILDGASVHVSMVGFDNGSEPTKVLDGSVVISINPNLTSTVDVTTAQVLKENDGLCFRPSEKGGPFELDLQQVMTMAKSPNPNAFPNSNVLRPWTNGTNLIQTRDEVWIVDFGTLTDQSAAALYERPYEYLKQHVQPQRATNRDERLRRLWWLHRRSGEDMRNAVANIPRMICTPRVSKHRIFVWIPSVWLPDTATYVFARQDDYFFGILHSRSHEVWARSQGTQVRERESGFRYTPTTCFETFPFPQPTAEQTQQISEAARALDELRRNWLNPPEWTKEEILEFPGSIDGPWARYVEDANEHGIGTVKYPRIVAKGDKEAEQLATRTLTNLYNERPTWLDLAHKRLDEAVFAAYSWDPSISDEEILARLLALNHERAKTRQAIDG